MGTRRNFDAIYLNDVVEALKDDRDLDFQKENDKYLSAGVCPRCSKRELFISKAKPYQLKCSRDGKCQFDELTRERYSYLFENLSQRFPKTDANPNATADAYLQRNRGFDVAKLAGWYTQGRRKMKSEEWADTVRFPLCNGHWERIIDERMVAANGSVKAGIKYGMSYTNSGWVPPGQTIERSDQVYVVEGIFHAIALHLAGFKVIASISCVNFPWEIIEANKGKLVTWVIALDDDSAGHKYIPKYLKMLRGLSEIGWVALAGERDWDDVYRDGQLNKAFMDEACYRGRLFTASSTRKLAYLVYLRRPSGFYLLEFANQLYSARVNQAELSKALGEEKVEGNREVFYSNLRIDQISNCIPNLDYLEKDIVTGEQRYYFDFKFPDRTRSCQAPLPSSAIAEPRGFVRALLDFTPGGNFEGGARELAMLKHKWLNDERRPVPTVRSLPFLGYDEESGTYCYPKFGFNSGSELAVNAHGYIQVKGAGVKTSLVNTRFERGDDFDGAWFPDFLAVHSLNGLTSLAWWTASLFVQQIGTEQASFPFLELTGDPGAGKSTLLRFLWRLIGRDNMEGIKPSGTGASAVGLSRAFAEVSNLPVVLIESDRTYVDANGRTVTVQFGWDEVKTLFDYHAPLRVTGAKTTGNETRVSIWRGALAISQNETVDGSEAILSRIVHLHCTTEHHSLALKPLADRLKVMKAKELGGYLRKCLANEQQWLARYFEAFPRYEQRLQSVGALTEGRIVQCHAQIMAAAYATQVLFPQWKDRDTEGLAKHLEARAIDRQQRCRSENPTAAKFWQIYHYLNEDVVTTIDGDGEREEIRETLNHSIDKELIGINIEHFQQACRKAGQDVIPDTQLRRALASSTTHKYIETRKARSRLEKRSLWLWFFSKRGEAS